MRRGALALLVACGPADDPVVDTAPEPSACETHAYQVTWDDGGEAFFLTHCRSCHSATSPDRGGAPDYLNYDTLVDVYAARHAIRQAALWDKVMPPGLPLEPDDAETLRSFLDCLD